MIHMVHRVNINVSAVDYEVTSKAIGRTLALLEERTRTKDGFVMTDSEFAFGWHFFVVSVNGDMVDRMAEQMGPDFERIRGKGRDAKFLAWLDGQIRAGVPRFKLAIKEEMESSKFGIF